MESPLIFIHRTEGGNIMKAYILRWSLLFCIGAFLYSGDLRAQFLEIEQVIYGMDCAPCARGVEARMQRIDGVKSITLSLNRGTAELILERENNISLRELQTIVRHSGFHPQRARVNASGFILRSEGTTFFRVHDEEYLLATDPLDERVLENVTPDTRVLVSGVVEEQHGNLVLALEAVEIITE